MKTRAPVVAGQFYPLRSQDLKSQIEASFLSPLGPGKLPNIKSQGEQTIVGLVSPHAGYTYSGAAAAQGFFRLAEDCVPKLIVLLGPNHTGLGSSIAVYPKGPWKTPLGSVEVNIELAREIEALYPLAKRDEVAHLHEHSIEVQLPFLQYIYHSQFQIVPISLLNQSLEVSLKLGKTLGKILKEKPAVIVASTDLTHYESQEQAEKKDRKALEAMMSLDSHHLYQVAQSLGLSMCGIGPVATLLEASKELGAQKGNLLKYFTSGDVTHDYGSVVGYASVEITK